MTAEAIAAVEAGVRIAAAAAIVILSIVVCLALAIRRRWPSLGVRAATSAVLVVGVVMSPALVLALADPALHRGFDAGVWLHPGLPILIAPAIVAMCVGVIFWRVSLERSASRGAA